MSEFQIVCAILIWIFGLAIIISFADAHHGVKLSKKTETIFGIFFVLWVVIPVVGYTICLFLGLFGIIK